MRKLVLLKFRRFAELSQSVNGDTGPLLQALHSIVCALESAQGLKSELTSEAALLSQITPPAPAGLAPEDSYRLKDLVPPNAGW